ncbi:MAG: exodeoxyribonuclease VII large subunit, partial [Candidatus Nanohaloarchaea archaeon]|nr:exodeoxyribonuclease VII large subunit [Candidatus Nanohaloarchaea archaeon]
QIASRVQERIETEDLQAAHVIGEVSNRREWKGNIFFTLKDDSAKLQCVIFARNIDDYRPDEGDRVLARGALDFYDEQGKLSLQANQLIPIGQGEYHRKLRKLKQELREDGVFDRERDIPDLPETIGVVTSEDSDAFHDIRESLHTAAPGVDIVLAPASVQGEDAVDELKNALNILENEEIDLIVIGRGGGDIEALKPFNTEELARTIYTASKPVIAGIGHREDETLAGLAADRRAIT